MKKLAIISTHPIQYNAPFFRLLAQRNKIEIKVFYTLNNWAVKVKDTGFNQDIEWDLPLLQGYTHQFVENISKKPSSKYYKGVDCPSILDAISSFEPDAVLVFGWNLKAHLKVMRYFKSKIPVFFRGDSTLIDEHKGWKQILRRLVLTWVYKHVDTAFYVGSENKKYFEAHGLKDNHLIFAPHAVDNDRFLSETNAFENKAKELAASYTLDRNRIGFVFAGKFEAKKNPMLLMQIACDDAFKNYNFIFVGNGILEKDMKNKAGNRDNIFFIPFQNQTVMPSVYRLGQFFVLPSQGPGETWGLAINEAMLSGAVPIVSDKVGCANDLVRDQQTGFVFESNNYESLKAVLLKLVDQTENIDLWTQNAKAIMRKYHYNQIAEAIENKMLMKQ